MRIGNAHLSRQWARGQYLNRMYSIFRWERVTPPNGCLGASASRSMRSGLHTSIRHARECAFEHVQPFLELLVRDHQRHQNTYNVSVAARGDQNQAVLVAIPQYSLRFFFRRLALV